VFGLSLAARSRDAPPAAALRLFVALTPPPEAIAQLREMHGQLQAFAQRRGLQLRYVPQAAWHVTLKFIGTFPRARLAALETSLGSVFRNTPAPAAGIAGAAGFPDDRRARVLVAGLFDPERQLESLAGACEQSATHFGVDVEQRRYRPHITFARSRLAEDLRPWVDTVNADMSLPTTPVRYPRACLFSSTLTPSGSVYRVLREYQLGP
jgi:2'-5' RNA ligase